MKTLAVRAAVTLVACASACALFAPAAAAVDIYAYANGCYALRDANTDRFVVRDALGYAATAPTAAAATPFRLQATALGRYLLYGPDGRMPSAGALDPLSPTTTPGPAADWRVTDGGGTLRLTNVSTGRHLGVGALGRLVQVASTDPRWSFAPAQGCATFPEVEVNVTGQPFKGPQPEGARARLRRRPHPPRRLRVPRRPLPLRASLEPVRSDGRDARLRRPLPQRRRRRSSRTSSPPAAPTARTAPKDGRASRAGRATSRSPTRAPTGSGSSARGGPGCGSWSTTSSRTGRSASSTRSSRTTATRWRARTSRPTTCTPSRTTSTPSSAARARASCGS